MGIKFGFPNGWIPVGSTVSGQAEQQGKTFLLFEMQTGVADSNDRIRLYARNAGKTTKRLAEAAIILAKAHAGVGPDDPTVLSSGLSVQFAGREFERLDVEMVKPGFKQYRAELTTKFRDYFITILVAAATPEDRDAITKTLEGFSLGDDTPDSSCGEAVPAVKADMPIVGIVSSEPGGPPAKGHIRVSQTVSKAFIVKRVDPITPKDFNGGGQVVLEVLTSKDGDVESISALSGNPLLIPAAMEAVKQWKFKPYLLNNQPIGMDTTVTLDVHHP
ncbi:energy transducer TonB [Candidatus Korobacter versatilis]|uniref:energy transducer TonB n=1 Tax=Candidatus Korobacter versatilis TaxID=658062 RepID=UPI00030702B5|nr:energy transducer TonB [Candidatus Koribacter versatilis]